MRVYMAPTQGERRQFGQRLRQRRRDISMSAASLADALAAAGFEVTTTAIGAWERGEYAPRTRELVEAVAAAVGDSDLGGLLGYSAPTADIDSRMTAVEQQVAELRRDLSRLLEHPRRPGREGPP